MATIRKRANKWQVQIRRQDLPQTKQQDCEEYFVLFNQDLQLLKRSNLPYNGKINYFYDLCSPVSEYLILMQAKNAGITVKWSDEDPNQNYSRRERMDLTRRNIFMAQNILNQTSYSKVVHWCGSAHLYGSPSDQNGENSIQEYLQLEGLKTHTIGLVPSYIELFNRNYQFIADDNDELTALKMQFKNNFSTPQRCAPVRIDLHPLTEKAGKNVPDELVIFSQIGYEWCQNIINQYSFSQSIEAEEEIWKSIYNKPRL
jgi:hypothetical protein